MRDRIVWLCTAAFVLAGCSDQPAGTHGLPQMPPAGTSAPPVAGAASVPTSTAGTTAPVASAGTAAPMTPRAGTSAPVATAGMAGAATPVAAGTGAPPSAAGAAAPPVVAGAGGSGSMPMMGMFNSEPIIPEVSGECPAFTSGTKTIMGLGGISLTAGAKKEGSGALLFYWHGTGSSAAEVSMFPAAARSEITGEGGVIVSFGRSLGSGGDCSGTGTFSLDDFKIVDLITACAVKNHGINPKRIYTTGCSAGGLMAGCMGIQRSNYVAATAPNSGGVTIGYGKFQDLTRVPAVMTMHGSPGGDVVIVRFAETSEAYDNYMMAKGAFAINCNHGGGHCGAPGSLQSSAWQFMKDHPFGTRPSPYASGLPMGFHSSCKIWTPTMRQPLGEGRPSM